MDNIFTRAKAYVTAHPRTSFQDAIQKVKGKKTVGAVKKAKKTASKVTTVRIGAVKKAKKAPAKVTNVRIGAVKKVASPISRSQKLIREIDRLEAQRSAEKRKQLKDVFQLVINKKELELRKIVNQLKK